MVTYLNRLRKLKYYQAPLKAVATAVAIPVAIAVAIAVAIPVVKASVSRVPYMYMLVCVVLDILQSKFTCQTYMKHIPQTSS